jgi:hypothetical protein
MACNCTKCNSNKPCGCLDPALTNPCSYTDCCDGETCEEISLANCVSWPGPDICEFDIKIGDRMDEVIKKLILATSQTSCIATFSGASVLFEDSVEEPSGCVTRTYTVTYYKESPGGPSVPVDTIVFSTPPICPDNSLHNDFVGEGAINLTLSLLGSKTYTMPANTLNQVGDVLSVKGAVLKNTNSITDIINVTIGGGDITNETSYLFSSTSQEIAHISIDFTYLTSTTFNTRLNIDFADLVLGIVRESIVLDSIQTLSASQDFLVDDITIQLLGQGSFTALDLQINKK